ncbi:MAG: ASKHA domain-containing protein [Oscillospiraceae bacterium]|jgi:uncharacterized 2Fe-2S/4Fe-4S cluster protein (DUF4445 family)|nr:ASKHA domain-containing protein [Oscillospiraceae bacterium]
MAKVTFQFENAAAPISIDVQNGERVLDVARKANVAIDAPCSGNGSCKKCKVQIGGEEVLACQTNVSGDLTVTVPDIAGAYKSRMKIADLSDEREIEIFNAIQADLSEFPRTTNLALLHADLTPPTLDDTTADWERLANALGLESASLYALTKLPDALRGNNWSVDCVVRGTHLLDIGVNLKLYGAAIDIGTTTVAAVLVDLESGEVIAKASGGNGQIRFGADVIHRIVESDKPGGLQQLQRAVISETIKPIFDALDKPIYRVVVAGNTTMNHLFLGLPPQSIRLEPYVPVLNEFPLLPAHALGIGEPDSHLIVAPNVGSYVGGDITAGTLASGLWKLEDEFALFIDLGTTGELVFGNRDFMFCCACSAGPALEGGDMSCGMRATDGAIESCVIDADTLTPTYSVIGGVKPIGLCGSGIIDTVAEMFRCRIINPKGKITAEGNRVKTSEIDGVKSFVIAFADETEHGRDLEISEIDLDNFIRTKAAIFSAIKTMLEAVDFSIDVISQVKIAGGIGSGINFENAIRIGMLPDIDRSLYTYIGNSSLAGAYAMLVSDDVTAKVTEIQQNMTYIDLSSHPGYMEEFVSACFLPHTDANLFPSIA